MVVAIVLLTWHERSARALRLCDIGLLEGVSLIESIESQKRMPASSFGDHNINIYIFLC